MSSFWNTHTVPCGIIINWLLSQRKLFMWNTFMWNAFSFRFMNWKSLQLARDQLPSASQYGCYMWSVTLLSYLRCCKLNFWVVFNLPQSLVESFPLVGLGILLFVGQVREDIFRAQKCAVWKKKKTINIFFFGFILKCSILYDVKMDTTLIVIPTLPLSKYFCKHPHKNK